MLKCYNYDVVFQEIPDETTLAINISNCPNRCPGCHSPHLWNDIGTPLTLEVLDSLINEYCGLITCICFMGGDAEPEMIDGYADHLRHHHPTVKVAWYSGRDVMAPAIKIEHFDYIKIGHYDEERGSLRQPNTNQRLYHINSNGETEDITCRFRQT